MTILWPPFVGWMFFCSLLFRILSRTRVTNESEGIYTRTNEEDGYMWNTDFTYQVNGKIITFDNIAGPWTVMEYTGTHLVMEAYNPNKMVWTLEKMY